MYKRRFYLWFWLTSLGAVALLVFSSLQSDWRAHFSTLFILGMVALLTELLLLRYPYQASHAISGLWLSVSTPIVVAVIVLYGWHIGVWLDALATLGAGVITANLKGSHWRWVWLNTAQSVWSAFGAGWVASQVAPTVSLNQPLNLLSAVFFALLAYNAINSLLVGLTVALVDNRRPRWVLTHSLSSLPREMLTLLPLSILVTVMLSALGVAGLVVILAPYLAVRQAFLLWTRQQELYHQTIRSLGFLIMRAHPYTGGHLLRVAQWARRVAERMNLPPERCDLVYEAALLHDIGKTVLDERILNKPGRLTPEEWQMIKRHPQLGAEILSGTPFLKPIVSWIAYHHERPDGNGYPYGLQGGQIPLEARIIAVVDAFDAMIGGEAPSQQRQYRRSLSLEEALAELERSAGAQFDAQVVQVFKEVVQESQKQTPPPAEAFA